MSFSTSSRSAAIWSRVCWMVIVSFSLFERLCGELAARLEQFLFENLDAPIGLFYLA